MGGAGSFGAMLFNFLVGQLLTYTHSYSLVLTIVGLLHPVSYLLVLIIVRRIEPLRVCGQRLTSRLNQ